MKDIITQEVIEKKIYLIRGLNVMLDKDIAELYDVETKILNRAVKRNIKRFPEDFMFQLTKQEMASLRFHFGTSNLKSQIATSKRGGRRYLPYAFTEQGVAMLASVLNSEQAIQVNIGIMRVFVNIRRLVSSNKEVISRLNQLEQDVKKHDKKIKTIFDVIHRPLLPSNTTLISPTTPFTNKMAILDVIKSCDGYIYWIDKYFSSVGLKLLSQALDNKRVKQIKILTSIDKVDEKLKDLFKDFKQELKNKGIFCEMRVIADNKVKSNIHDRWIISKNKYFNVPSTDTLARGQYSEVKETTNKPPFNDWWSSSKDILKEWNDIKNIKK